MSRSPEPHQIPAALKLSHTAFVAVLVPTYWRHYGAGNFLWFSDIALLLSVPALWRPNRLLVSSQAIAVAVPEGGWTADFIFGLMRGRTAIGLAEYMFDRKLPRALRALSLFHLWLPALLVWLTCRLGYDRRALPAQTLFGSGILIATYRWTKPQDNVNWVFGLGTGTTRKRPSRLVVALVMFPLAFYVPAHLLLARLCRRT